MNKACAFSSLSYACQIAQGCVMAYLIDSALDNKLTRISIEAFENIGNFFKDTDTPLPLSCAGDLGMIY